MKIENITEAVKNRDQSITLTITDPFEKTKSEKQYVAIRGGISWPTANSPAYFCVIGQEFVDNKRDRQEGWEGKRVLLAEYFSDSLFFTSTFYKRITDVAEQMLCHSFYVAMPEEERYKDGFLNDFWAYSKKIKGNASLCEALDVDNFFLGVTRITQDIDSGRLKTPNDSIVHSQLQDITREDLKDKPEETFWAVNALRHVIGSYHRHNPIPDNIMRRLPPARNWRVM